MLMSNSWLKSLEKISILNTSLLHMAYGPECQVRLSCLPHPPVYPQWPSMNPFYIPHCFHLWVFEHAPLSWKIFFSFETVAALKNALK